MGASNISDTHRFLIESDHEGGRLDKVLTELVDDLSRSRIQALIDEGEVTIDDQICQTASRKLNAGEEIVLKIPPPKSADPEPENIPLDIVFEDEHLIVLNKPVGLVVHPGAGNYSGTLVNALLHYCGDDLSGIGGVLRPGIVHRLDKETSGLMVVAKNDKAHQGLSAQLEDRSLLRRYKALVLGNPMPPKGEVDQPIGRHPGNRLKMAVSEEGKLAKTYYKVIQSYRDEFALLECALESGRTHQIRVHMAYIKYPIVGDPLYGPQRTAVQGALKRAEYDPGIASDIAAFSHQLLHAFALSFVHPVSGEQQSFEQDSPESFIKVLKLLDN